MLNYKKFEEQLKYYGKDEPVFQLTQKEKKLENFFDTAVKKAGFSNIKVSDIDVDLLTFDDLDILDEFYDKYYIVTSNVNKLVFSIKRMGCTSINCNYF